MPQWVFKGFKEAWTTDREKKWGEFVLSDRVLPNKDTAGRNTLLPVQPCIPPLVVTKLKHGKTLELEVAQFRPVKRSEVGVCRARRRGGCTTRVR